VRTLPFLTALCVVLALGDARGEGEGAPAEVRTGDSPSGSAQAPGVRTGDSPSRSPEARATPSGPPETDEVSPSPEPGPAALDERAKRRLDARLKQLRERDHASIQSCLTGLTLTQYLFKVLLRPDGTAEAHSRVPGHPDAEDCLNAVVAGWTFPNVKPAALVIVTTSVVFTQSSANRAPPPGKRPPRGK
jgi:hypothetical protein